MLDMTEEVKKRAEAESRCIDLQEQIVSIQERCNQKVSRVKAECANGFDFLKAEVFDLKSEKADYLKRIDKKNRIIAFLSVVLAIVTVAAAAALIFV